MSDTTTSEAGDATPAEGSALSLSQAVQILAERRSAQHKQEGGASGLPSNPQHDAPDADLSIAADDQISAVPNAHTEAPQPTPEIEPHAATIEIDGVKLTADDVRRGYMRQADYSRKTQTLAHASRAVEAERTVKLAKLDHLINALETQNTREPDWAQVARADPLGWVQKKTQWDSRRTALESAKRISDAVHADTLARDRKTMVAELASTYNPAWADAQIMDRDFRDLANYALSQGFSRDEVNTISHAREMVLLDKARRWDALQHSKASMGKRLTTMPKVQRPGTRATVSSHQRSLGHAWEQFLKNPTVENGAAYQRAKRDAASYRRNAD